MNVSIVTDSGSDLTPAQLKDNGIVQVPLSVSFGSSSYLSPDEMRPEEFWRRLLEPGAPFPHSAAPSAGQFKQVFEGAFEGGAEGIVCVTLAETLSATIHSAQMAKDMLPGKEIHIVDSRTACMGIGALALRGAGMAAQGLPAARIAEELTRIRESVFLYVALETLDFLRKGGRISAAQAAIGGLLSVKPIITVVDGLVVAAEKPRTRSKARARVIELLSEGPVAEAHVLYSPPAEVDDFRDELLAHLPAPAPKLVTAQIIGPVIGTHVGPGVLGAVMLTPS